MRAGRQPGSWCRIGPTKTTERERTAGGPLAEKRPAMAAVVVDFAALTAAARPWVEVALSAALTDVPDDTPPGRTRQVAG